MGVFANMADQSGTQRIGDDVTGYLSYIFFLAYCVVVKSGLPDSSSCLLIDLINVARAMLLEPSYQ